MARFREFTTKHGTIILSGKSAENNEELVAQVGKDELVFHTVSPGSPFVNIKGEPKRSDIKTAAIICAKYSKEWKQHKEDVKVHKFKGAALFKDKTMKTGTFGVRRYSVIRVKKKWIEEFNP